MARKTLSSAAVDFIRNSIDAGDSRSKIIAAGRDAGFSFSDRDVQKVRFGTTPEAAARDAATRAPSESAGQRRPGVLSNEDRLLRDSWRRNADKVGIDSRIRGNADYQKFRSEIKQIEASKNDLRASMGTRAGNKEYQKQRLDTYLKFGLISQDQYDDYIRRKR